MAPTPKPVDDDFDAWFTDTVKPWRFKLLGKVWELPGSAPAIVVMRYQRIVEFLLQTADTDAEDVEVPEDLVDEDLSYEALCRALVGEEIVDQWFDDGLDQERLQMVAIRLIQRYILKQSDLMGVGVGKAPRAPQDRRRPVKKAAAKKTTTPRKRTSPPPR